MPPRVANFRDESDRDQPLTTMAVFGSSDSYETKSVSTADEFNPAQRKPPRSVPASAALDQLLTVEDVARRLNVSRDWVWDHSSRKEPHLPVIRMGDGALRYRSSAIEDFINERERLSAHKHRRR